MKARILALLALVLGLASCQTEPEGLDVNVGGEVETTVCVSLPEATRANSAEGAFANVDWSTYTIRYQMEVYDSNGRKSDAVYEQYLDGNVGKSVVFPVRLVPNRDYNFVVWADIVTDDEKTDLHYNTANLNAVSVITKNNQWKAMDETRDAFTGYYNTKKEGTKYTSSLPINITLTRPFAKLRVITTDMVELGNLNITPVKAVASYTTAHYSTFNACDATYSGELTDVRHEYVIANYADNTRTNKVLFTDYFFAAEGDVVKFSLDVLEENGARIKKNDFNTDIAVNRNYLTTIAGNILTEGSNITVTVDPVFENANNPGDAPYYYEAVTNAVDLIKALMAGKEIIVLNHITVTAVDVALATRSGEAINPVINLNGFTITIENENTEALVNLNGGTLTVEGEGAIVSNEGALVKGTTVVTEGATVDADVAVDAAGKSAVKTGLDALVYICENGGEFTFTDNFEIDNPLAISTTKPVVINGNGKTITYTGSARAFNVNGLETANVTLNDLTFVNSASYSERCINFNVAGKLTLNNVTVGATGTPATYAINLPGSSDGAEVVINNSNIRGNIALNIWGEKAVVNATNTIFSNYDSTEVEDYTTIVLNNDGSTVAEGAVVNITGGKVIGKNEKGEPLHAVNNGTVTGVVNISETTEVIGAIKETVAIVDYNSTSFYSYTTIQGAINKVCKDNKGFVRLVKDITVDETITIPADGNVTIDLNGKIVSGKTFGNTNPQELFLVKGNLTVNNGTITTEHEGDNLGWSAMTTIFDITGGGVVNLNGVTAKNLGGTDMNFVAHLNNWGTASFNVENSTLEATYIAVRVFNSGPDMNNVSIKNTTLKGKYCFWVHNYNAAGDNCGYGGGTDATLNIDIFNGTNTFEYTGIAPVLYGFNNPIYYVLRDNGNAIYKQYSNEAKIVKYNGNADTFNVESAINDVTVTTIGNRAFKNAVVSTVELPSSITTLEEGAFQGAAIKSITIPENVTVLGKQSIGYCPELETIVINAKNVVIDNYVARACAKLKSVYIYSDSVEFINKSMYFTNKENADASAITFYVSSQAVADVVYNAQSTSHSYGIKIVSIDGTTTYYNTLK